MSGNAPTDRSRPGGAADLSSTVHNATVGNDIDDNGRKERLGGACSRSAVSQRPSVRVRVCLLRFSVCVCVCVYTL